MTVNFDAYLKALAATPVDQKTEHTDRGALERLLNEAAAQSDARLRVQHEPRRDKGGGGSPDYMIDKYLKSRKGRILNLDEQTHVGNIAESLNFTIAQMAKIDTAYLEAFPPT